MWYVMQVMSGWEGKCAMMLERNIPDEILEKCFVPMRRMKKKYHGKWHEVTEKLFPGYVFLVSGQPRVLYDELKNVPMLTKLLGSCEEYFTPLSQKDVRFLHRLQNMESKSDGVGISKVSVGEDSHIRVIAGPLKNLEGQIRKINLHKRIALVEADFMGNRALLHLGIEIVEGK